MGIYDEIDPIEYAELYQSIYPDWKGRQEFLGLLSKTIGIKSLPRPEVEVRDAEITHPVQDLEIVVPEVQSDEPQDSTEEIEYIDFTPTERLPLKCDEEAKLLGYFCNLVLERIDYSESKTQEWALIAAEYNSGMLASELYALKGKRTERALRIWVTRFQESQGNMYSLLHGNKYLRRKRKLTDLEGKVLLAILLHPNRVSIGSAIKLLKAKANLKMIESPTSVPTLRRWCEEWRSDNLAIWEQARQGSKYVAEHIIKTIHRDSRLLSVGEVWVADGHTLAFDIVNPTTGREQRMTMIMVLDWASRYPVGAALAFTEDSQHIQVAFRNAFLNWGALPQYVYLDNGKAFKSKLFHEQWEGHDLAKELGGIFPKLGIKAQFAASYNAKAKVIERFFRTFQDQFERFISSFRGASVADKPATLMRNEKWAEKLFACKAPTIEEAMRMIGFYIRYVYGETPHSGIGNRKPWEVFSSAPLPQDRLVDPARLNFMKLAAERKSVRSEGIVFNKLQYWHQALVGQIGKPVVIRYDLADARWILVYDQQDVFICQAVLRQSQHPFIYADMNNAKSHKAYKQEYAEIKKLQRQTEQRTKQFVRSNQESVDRLLEPLMTEISAESNPTFIQPAILEAPPNGPEEEIARLEKLIIHEEPPLATETTEVQQIEESDQFDPFNDEEFKKMLKTIGIN